MQALNITIKQFYIPATPKMNLVSKNKVIYYRIMKEKEQIHVRISFIFWASSKRNALSSNIGTKAV